MSIQQDPSFENIKDQIKKEQGEKGKEKKNTRYVSLTPEKTTTLEEWQVVVKKHFPDLSLPAEVGLSVMAQLLIDDITNPFALVYVDAPSSGKTITLNFFSQLKDLVYTTDDFTPASFVSHSANTKKKDLEKNDLLPQIRYKTIVVRDLAPIFAKRDEDVQAMLGILIRVLDGEGYESNSGLYGKRGYVGDYLFMMLSASTPIRPHIWKVMGNLGSRLFFLNIGSKGKDAVALAKQLEKPCRENEVICREITTELVKTLWSKYPEGIIWDVTNDNQELREQIGKIAKTLAKLRATLNVWKELGSNGESYEHTQPIEEHPDRINQLLYNLARGHAVVCGREQISVEDIDMVLRVALDSGKPVRAQLFKSLIKNNGTIKTSVVKELLKCSTNTALKAMEEMRLLGLVSADDDLSNAERIGRPETSVELVPEFRWLLKDVVDGSVEPHSGEITENNLFESNLTL
jgi:hypothetical protein